MEREEKGTMSREPRCSPGAQVVFVGLRARQRLSEPLEALVDPPVFPSSSALMVTCSLNSVPGRHRSVLW